MTLENVLARSGDIRVPSHNGIGNRNMVTKLRQAKGNKLSNFHVGSLYTQ